MGKRFKSRREKEEELDKVVRQAFIRDGDRIEKEIEKDNEYEPDEQDAQELYQRIMTRIEAEEAAKKASEAKMASTTKYREIPTEALEREEFRQQYRRKRRRRKKVVKWVAVVAATLVGVFGVTMTSQANRMYFMDTVNYLVGNRVQTRINSGAEGKGNKNEKKARDLIENKTGIKVPMFLYMPPTMEFKNYSYDEQIGLANMEYEVDGVVVSQFMKENEKKASASVNPHGKKLNIVEIEMVGVSADVWKIQDADDKAPSYIAQWEYQNVFYQLTGKLEEDEFLNILKQIIY